MIVINNSILPGNYHVK